MKKRRVTVETHRGALSRWLDELDQRHGPPTAKEFARAGRVIDEALGLHEGRTITEAS